MHSRAQVGLEYLVFTAFLLLMSALLFAYAYANYSNTIQVVQSQSAVDAVAAAVDFVYAKGPGNAVVVDVKLPVGLTEFRVDQNVVRLKLTQYGHTTDIFTFTKATVDPNYLYFQEGLYSLRIAMGDTNASVSNV